MSVLNRRALTGSTLVVLAVLFIALVMLTGVLFRGARVDLTQDKLYTLSDGTRALINKIEEPVNLQFYFSDSVAGNYPGWGIYAARVRELLEEMVAVAPGKLRLEVIDPQPFSEDEDRATGFGLQAVPLGGGAETLFFGLAGSNAVDGQMAIPFFQPDKETFLEYDIAKLISGLSGPAKPVVGVLSGLNMAGGFDPARGGMTPAWVVNDELAGLFELRALETTLTRIDDDVELLMVVHPKSLSDDTLYAIDQFVLRGGRLLAFVDPHAEAESAGDGADPMASMMADKSSTLGTLFDAWGVAFDPARVVLDAENALQLQTQPDQPPQRHLAVLGIGRTHMNQDDVITAQLDAVNLASTGHFVMKADSTLKLEPLIQSSLSAATVGTERIRFVPDPKELFNGFQPNTTEAFVLAGRLSGPLKSAFPARVGEGHLAEAEQVSIVLFGDTDLLSDRMWVQVQQFFGQRAMTAFAKNGDLVVNAVDNLVGSSDLIGVRARTTSSRPFTRVEMLKRQADDRFRAKEQELQTELTETERQLTELQSQRSGDDGGMLLSVEQQAAIKRFQDQKLRIRKDLRDVRRELDEDISRLGAQLKIINIAGVPLLLTVLAIAFAWSRVRRRRQESQA
ncbi:Gldg family protein [Aquimonas sp.]|jgi:ABC-type uncharacterized transport system involved in gliding motility auxiliary subunit|uniref:GldG family protein n=1 Tax=Aquimonas sp. TaxID=1872588 RepID=UPI0037BF35BA